MKNWEGKTARRAIGVFVTIMLSAMAAGSWAWFRIGPVERGRSSYERGDWREAANKARERLKAVPDDRTGQDARPATPRDYLGVLQTDDANRRCLGSHTTHALAWPDGVVATAEHGFSCERCHGPAGNHLAAIHVGFPDPAIGRPRLAAAANVNALCGQCHSVVRRVLAWGGAPTWPGSRHPRFQ
jgi:Doubled CXXCH motif (Paired_CXXCH_1)